MKVNWPLHGFRLGAIAEFFDNILFCPRLEFNRARTATPWNPTLGYPVFHNYKHN